MKNQRNVKNTSKQSVRVGYNQPGKRKFSFKQLIRPAIYLAIFLILAYAVAASSLLRIKNVIVEGAITVSPEEVRHQVENIISGSPLTQNIIFTPTSHIASSLKKDNYQIASVEVERIPFNTLKVKIKEQKPIILWQTGSNTYILSENGHGYDGEVTDKLKRELPLVVDTTNLPVKKGEKVTSETFVKFVKKLSEELPKKDIKYSQIQVGETTTELYVKTNDGYLIRFDTSRELNPQLNDLMAVLNLMKSQGKKASEYVDVRINGRAFYK